MVRVLLILFLSGFVYKAGFHVYAQEQELVAGLDFDKIEQFDRNEGLPRLYFGMTGAAGKYRESAYSHMLAGFGLSIGIPIDRVLSAEWYADFHFHFPGESGGNFWKSYYRLRPSVDFDLGGFKTASTGGRLRFLLFRHWELLCGGGIGAWATSLIINGIDYGRLAYNMFEAELSTGYVHDISKKWSLGVRATYKNYFIDEEQRHEMAWIFGITGTYKWYRPKQ